MKKILITGAAGFLGSHLCERFLKEKFYVIGMDNFITGSMANIKLLRKHENFEFINHDVSKFIQIDGQLDYILHFASPASPIDYLKIPIQTLKVGSLGTHNLLGLAKSKNAIILVASTSEIYGDPLVHPQKETYFGNDFINPPTPLGEIESDISIDLEVVWQKNIGEHDGSNFDIFIFDEFLFSATSDGTIKKINRITEDILWEKSI